MSSETETATPSAPSRPPWALGCAVVLVFALIIASIGAYQAWVERTWPPQILHPSSRHYHVVAAPAEMALPQGGGPSLTEINEVGQVLVHNGNTRSMLYIPPGIDGTDAHVVDFNAILDVPADQGLVAASTLNAYGQVAGYVEWRGSSPRRSALFLWTPRTAHSATGSVTYLTDPQGKATYTLLLLNSSGQVAFDQENEVVLWTPEAPHGEQGMAQALQQVGVGDEPSLGGLNAYGQLAGRAAGRTFLWTPSRPQGTLGTFTWLGDRMDSIDALNDDGQVVGHDTDAQVTLLWTPTEANESVGQLTRIPKPSNTKEMHVLALSARGALAGIAINASHALGNGPVNDALVWLPDAPNVPAGHLRTLGALGWNEDSSAWAINSAGTALGDSCFLERNMSDVGCQQLRSFVWDPKEGMQDLQTLLDTGSGYTLERAVALNEQGQIAATGRSAEGYRLLVLTPH